MQLTTKVLLTLTLVIAVALVTASALIGRGLVAATRSYLNGRQQQQLSQLAQEAGQQYAQSGDWSQVQAWLDQSATLMPGYGMMAGMRGQGRGNAMRGNQAAPDAVRQVLLVDVASGAPLGANAAAPDRDLVALAAPVTVDGRDVARLVPLSATARLGPDEEALLAQVNQAILWSGLAAGLVALLVGSLLIASILSPLHKLEGGVARVAQGDLSARVAVHSRDEIGRLSESFNSMAASLEEQERLRQRMVTDIAHELRTPLSVIQGNLQAILDGVYPLEMAEVRTVLEETQLLARLVNDLHELAQAEAGQLALARQIVPVASVLGHMAEAFEPLAAGQQVALQVELPAAALQVDADPDRLQQILHNLLGNALRHTPAAGRILLSARAGLADSVRFWVQDSGPGLAAEDLPFVFDRFYRGDPSRARPAAYTSGAGLGLAIVKALVEAHGGAVGVESTPGHGATFWFDLPAA